MIGRKLLCVGFALSFWLCGCAATDKHHKRARPALTTADFNTILLRNSWVMLEDLDWPEPQRVNRGYDAAGREAFWTAFAGESGTEIYCRASISKAQMTAKKVHGRGLTLEHAVPAVRIAETFGYAKRDCETRGQGPRDQEACLYATAELHNLWPAFGGINSSRQDLGFGELPGEDEYRRFKDYCPDFERSEGADAIVEPTDDAQGDLARSILFMHFVYGVPLGAVVTNPALLLEWHENDPPDAKEKRRNRIIFEHEGIANPLIEAITGPSG